MQFYGERPFNNYSRPPRRQSKNYTTIQAPEPRDNFCSKSTRKRDNMNPYKENNNYKQNAIPNCKSTVHIQFALDNVKSNHQRQRSSSFLNKSQISTNNPKAQESIYQKTQKKIKSRSRWETTQYNKNYEFKIQDNDPPNQLYKKYSSKSKNYQKYDSIDVAEPYNSSKKMPSSNLDSYSNEYNLKKYWAEPQYKLSEYKTEISDSSKPSNNTPFYERIKNVSSLTPSFKSDDNNFMSKTISFESSETKLSFLNQSLGGNKYQQLYDYDNFDFKTEIYSPRMKNGSGSQAKMTMAKIQSTKEPDFHDFIIGQCKGEGRFGKVYMAVHKKTGFLCALKKIKKQSVKYMMDQFIQQIKIQLYLNHPKLVKVYGYFADKEYFYMLVQYMEQGSLYSLMKKNKKLEEAEAAEKLYEICQGIKEMHDQNIVHRDLKPENVVITNGVCKICDFGWAAICQDRRQTYCGTLDYVCPEIVQGNAYDSSADIWCIGVLAYQLMCGKAPFYDISRQKTIQKIKSCKIDSFPSHLSKKAVKFIQMILKKNPDSRVGVCQLLESDFLRFVRK